MHHLEKTRKRVTGSSLSQHLGKSVALLGEFVQLEPNGQVFTLRTSSSDVVTVQLQQPFSSSKMRGLPLRPDDSDLFQNITDVEKTAFFMSHQGAFKRMWTEEGKVYWLRFLLTFKGNFESTVMVQPEYQFIFKEDEDERLVSFVFISIHDMFVNCSFSVVQTFVSNIFIAIKHLHNLKEPSKMNPFCTKESREAFRAILGRPDEHEDFSPAIVAFVLSIYSLFMGAVCVLLKRWLKEPDLSEGTKNSIDYTYFYWKPSPDWMDEDFWASCFEKHLAVTYKDELPKLLLTANIQNIFVEYHDDCLCNNSTDNATLFEMLKANQETDSDYCIKHERILKPNVISCKIHSSCYLKVLHSPKCLEPYLCEGSEHCTITCEKTLILKSNSKSKSNPTTFWKKNLVETFSCKQPNMRHASTLAQSIDTQIETFVHGGMSEIADIICKHHDEETEFMMELLHDPEMMNSFNQHKRKEEYKNRLRTKFRQKYFSGPKDFEDPSYCMSLFESAQKLWIMGVFEENFSKLKNGGADLDRTNLFDSRQGAETTVAVGTSCVLTGRVVTPSVHCVGHSATASKVVEKDKVVPENGIGNEVKSKSKKSKSKKKKKNKLNNGSNEKNVVPVDASVEKKAESVNEAKDCPAVVSEKGGGTLNKDSTTTSVLEGKNPITIMKNGPELTNEKNSTRIEKQESTEVNKSDALLECNSKHCTNDSVKQDVDKEDDLLCCGRCPPQNQTSNECSSKNCCPCVLCKKKGCSTQNNIFQNNSSVITEKPKKTSKVNATKVALEIAKTETDNTIQTKADVDEQLPTENLNTNSVDSGNLSEAVEVNVATFSNSQDEGSLDLKKKAPVIHNLKLIDLKTDQKAPVEMVINPDMKVSNADVMDKNEAINGLTFESEEEKTVEDFLTLIGVINKPKDEPTSNCVESDSNQKDDTRLLDRKLKVCAFCAKKEVTYKTFKRCARCKTENFPEQLYYCSRQCQVDDWQESHRDEHLKRTSKK